VALDAPEAVHTLALLEPGLPNVLFSSAEFAARTAGVGALYQAGDKAGAVDAFARAVAGADYRAAFDRHLPSGWFERWVADLDTVMLSDMPALQLWSFTGEDAARIAQPVLNLTGAHSESYFREIYNVVATWFPQAENDVLPDASHAMTQTNPKGAAERQARFFASHPL